MTQAIIQGRSHNVAVLAVLVLLPHVEMYVLLWLAITAATMNDHRKHVETQLTRVIRLADRRLRQRQVLHHVEADSDRLVTRVVQEVV